MARLKERTQGHSATLRLTSCVCSSYGIVTRRGRRGVAGFSLTEMLVTMLILTLASTLLAAGVPTAINTYRRTVKSANAQMALSTTATVLRSELGMASDVREEGGEVYYLAADSSWACIRNASSGDAQGLVKQYYTGEPKHKDPHSVVGLSPYVSDGKALSYPLISDAAVTEGLEVRYDSATLVEKAEGSGVRVVGVEFTNLRVYDVADPKNNLADMGTEPYYVCTRFTITLVPDSLSP